jgi:hypothetical protein
MQIPADGIWVATCKVTMGETDFADRSHRDPIGTMQVQRLRNLLAVPRIRGQNTDPRTANAPCYPPLL